MIIESELIAAAQQKDRSAQKAIYQAMVPYLRGVVIRYLREFREVDDVLQESFIKIFANLEHYDPNRGTFQHWATRITVNEAIMNLRRRKSKATEALHLDQHDIAVLPTIVEQLSDDQMLTILKQMPTNYYEVFNLAVIEGYPHEEIASLLGISVWSSRKKLSRARAWIKKTFRSSAWLNNSYHFFKTISK